MIESKYPLVTLGTILNHNKSNSPYLFTIVSEDYISFPATCFWTICGLDAKGHPDYEYKVLRPNTQTCFEHEVPADVDTCSNCAFLVKDLYTYDLALLVLPKDHADQLLFTQDVYYSAYVSMDRDSPIQCSLRLIPYETTEYSGFTYEVPMKFSTSGISIKKFLNRHLPLCSASFYKRNMLEHKADHNLLFSTESICVN